MVDDPGSIQVAAAGDCVNSYRDLTSEEGGKAVRSFGVWKQHSGGGLRSADRNRLSKGEMHS